MADRFHYGLRPAVIGCSVALALILLASLPSVTGAATLSILVVCGYYVLLATSWNLLSGYTGQFSLAHVGFAAIGAYTVGLTGFYWSLQPALAIVLAAVVCGILGTLLGLMVMRLQWIHLAIATWALAATTQIALSQAYGVTRGDLGLEISPLFGSSTPVNYYYLFLSLCVATQLLIWLILRSRIGLFFAAIHDDEVRAASLGVRTTFWKLVCFAITSMLAGVAGAAYAPFLFVIDPRLADFSVMALVIVMVVVGGMGSFWGPVLGAMFVGLTAQYLQGYGSWNLIILSLILLIVVRAWRGGLMGVVSSGYDWLVPSGWRPR